MFFPTWLEMVFLLVAFVWTTLQQLTMVNSGSHSIVRMLLLALYILIMLIVVLYNREDPRLSSALFLLSVAALGITIHLYRRMPARLPDEPKF